MKCQKITKNALLALKYNLEQIFILTMQDQEKLKAKVIAKNAQIKKFINGKKKTKMNTTHINERTEQNAMQKANQFLEKLMMDKL